MDNHARPVTAPPKQRQRRHHQRSRNGCITCKKRHVRCDEARPLCMNCARSGGECGYLDPFIAFTGSGSSAATLSTDPGAGTGPHRARHTGQQVAIISGSGPSSSAEQDGSWQLYQPRSASLVDMSPRDALAGLMLSGPLTKLPARSRWLFHTFAQRSIQDRPGAPGPKESFAVHKALSNPGMLHVCLSLSAIHTLWSSGSGSWASLTLPLQYHKVEAYRYIRQQIENPQQADNDTTITTVASLALLEASLWEITSGPAAGSIYNIMIHLQGLRKIVEAYLKPRASKQTLFQRAITMGVTTVQQGLVMDPQIAQELADDVYQPLVPAILFMSLWPDPMDGWWNSEVKPEAKPWFATTRSPGTPLYQPFKDVPADPVQFSLFRAASRNSYYTAFLYLCIILREGALSSFILKLLVDQLLDDAERTAKAFVEERCNRSLWFWTVMMTLAAVASAPTADKLEALEMLTWRGAIRGKIKLANSILGLTDWESAKAHLKLIAWKDGFDGEDELRRLWEDIAWDGDGSFDTTLVLLGGPDYEPPDETGLPTPELTVTPEPSVPRE